MSSVNAYEVPDTDTGGTRGWYHTTPDPEERICYRDCFLFLIHFL